MITFDEVAIRRGTKLLITGASFRINKNDKIGITGRNGCGKSSLLALIKGQIESDAGHVKTPKGIVIAHVSQESPTGNISALAYTLQGDGELCRIRQSIAEAEQHDEQLLPELYEKLEHIDGYTADSRANSLLHGLGFSTLDAQKAVNSFSGGWKVRLNLAQALMCRSDLLLLDEPTNHLDLNTVLWLQNWLTRYQGTLLLISHDREFLDNCVNAIAHIEQQGIKLYPGNYSAFETQRAAQLAQQQASFVKQQKEIQHIQSFITRFKAKATKAKQAQSRIKALGKIQLIAQAHVDSPFSFSFARKKHLPHNLMSLNQVVVSYGEHVVLNNIDLQITAHDRIALLGANGAGKSTLIKVLAQQIKPQAGELIINKDIKVGYFAQHQVEQLRPDQSPLQHMITLDRNAREQELRNHLGGFGFIGDQVNETTEHFSGGEKSRLALAMLVYQQPDVLLLDEPTNHLDLEMRHALALALQDFNGALIIISHDSHLLQTIADRLLLVQQKKIDEFDGDLTAYIKMVLQTQSGKSVSVNANSQNNQYTLRKLIKKLENKLNKINRRQQELKELFADGALYNEDQRPKLDKLNQEKIALDEKLEETERAWLAACEELEG